MASAICSRLATKKATEGNSAYLFLPNAKENGMVLVKVFHLCIPD